MGSVLSFFRTRVAGRKLRDTRNSRVMFRCIRSNTASVGGSKVGVAGENSHLPIRVLRNVLSGCLRARNGIRVSCVRNSRTLRKLIGRAGKYKVFLRSVSGDALFPTVGTNKILPEGAFSVKRTGRGECCVRYRGVSV